MDETDIKKFGEYVKNRRKKLGVSINDMAQAINASAGGLRNIESGAVNAVGTKMRTSIENFLNKVEAGSIHITHASSNANNDSECIKTKDLENLACLVNREDFSEKVNAIATVLDGDKITATIALFKNALKK